MVGSDGRRRDTLYILAYTPKAGLENGTVGCNIVNCEAEKGPTIGLLPNTVASNLNPTSLHFTALLGGTAESDCAYSDSVAVMWSVLPYVCRLSHSCTLLKLLDGMRCHLAETLV